MRSTSSSTRTVRIFFGLQKSGTALRSIGCSNCKGYSRSINTMSTADLMVNRVVVFASALVYWAGVYLQARRIRRRIGRAPNVKPRGTKERLLWAGWSLVVIIWLILPFLAGTSQSWSGLELIPSLCGRGGLLIGIVLTLAGYAGTLWCYAAMGNAWRMGV